MAVAVEDSDLLGRSLEGLIKKLLRDARHEPFEQKINALKVAIVWYTTSRKLAGPKTDTGALLEEMRQMVEGKP